MLQNLMCKNKHYTEAMQLVIMLLKEDCDSIITQEQCY